MAAIRGRQRPGTAGHQDQIVSGSPRWRGSVLTAGYVIDGT